GGGLDGGARAGGDVGGGGELVGGGGLARLHQPLAQASCFPAASTQGIGGDERPRQRCVAGLDSLDVGDGLGTALVAAGRLGDAEDLELAGLGGDELDV